MRKHITIESAKLCCGCGACVNACALGAITMKEDEAGFIYPFVDTAICVECGKCVDVCTFTKKGDGANGEIAVYAAASKNEEVLKSSSSGGIFTELAKEILKNGGAVFGAAWTDDFTLEHICVENEQDLTKLRGSKYVQSNTGTSFSLAKKLLDEERQVCFCGTPCQVSALKAFLKKDYKNLYTVDLVCHGVPNIKMLKDDLKNVLNDKYSKIENISFRDKSYGWGVKGSIKLDNSKVKYNAGNSPYYFYFLKGEVYRESCYNCRYPLENRQGDITLGDYWGISLDLIEKMGDVNADLGVSCVLVNTEKGEKWLDSVKDNISLAKSSRQAVQKRNHQLTAPSAPLPEHKTLLNGYIENGYSSFKAGYKKHIKDHIIRTIKNMIPAKVKRKINDLLS